MSTTIDNRVVEMGFDNRDFERNVQTSLSTLERLKQGLNLTGASKGFEMISNAARRVDLSAVSYGVESVGLKFNALYTIADQALRNIVNSAMAAGKRITSALTLDPIKTGFTEYETQINAVQTILANTKNKGTTIDNVNAALDELNTYADKTIYNFTEMTRNIGTFTAAGVDLDKSVSSIKGIANLAAVSGSTSQQASTAMYQLSQALAAGKVQLMDWNSVVNAGMGGQVFQDALKRTAKNLGTNVDAMIKKYGSFRESLTKGQWLTAEVLTETLSQLAGAYSEADLLAKGYTKQQAAEILDLAKTAEDAATKVKTVTQLWDTLKESAQSGWTQTWEIIVGDFEEAKELLTKVSDTIGAMISKSAEGRNAVLQGWKDAGGRDDLIKALSNGFQALMNVVTPVKNAFREIFPPITVDQLVNFTRKLREFSEQLVYIPKFATLAKNGIKQVIAGSDEVSEHNQRIASTIDKITRTFKGLFAGASLVVKVLKAAGQGFMELLGVVAPVGGDLLTLTANIGDWIVKLDASVTSADIFANTIGKISEYAKKAIEFVRPFGTYIKNLFAEIKNIDTSGVTDFFSKIQLRFSPLTKLGELVVDAFIAIGDAIKKAFPVLTRLGSIVAKAFRGIGDAIISAFESADFNQTFDLINGGLFAGILYGIKQFIGSMTDIIEGDSNVLNQLKDILDGVKGSLEAWQGSLKADTLLKIAGAVGILTVSLIALSMIDSAKLTAALASITVVLGELMGGMKLMSMMGDGGTKGMATLTGTLLGMATSLLILSAALKIMSTMSPEEMVTALIAMTAGLSALVIAVNKLPKSTALKSSGLTGLATSLVILGGALKIMGSMSTSELAIGLSAMAGSLTAVVLAVKFLPRDTALKTAGLIALASSLVILGAALKIMSTIKSGELGLALVAMGVGLSAVVIAVNSLPKDTALKTAGLIGLSTSLVILAGALKIMGSMAGSELTTALMALGGSLLILVMAVNGMSAAVSGAAALLIISAALMILAPALQILGSMNLPELGMALLTLAGAFTLIGVAAAILSPFIPAIMGLGVGIAAIGIGCLAAGAGLLMFSAGLSALAVSGAAGTAALVTMVSAIASLIPMIFVQIGNGILALVGIIANGGPAICQALTVVLTALCEAVTATIPPLLECLGLLLDSFLAFIVEYIPKLVTAGMELLLGILTGIAQNIGKIVETTLVIIGEFINGIAAGLPDVIQAGINLMISFINGMADGIRENTDATIEAVNNLMDAIFEAIGKWFNNAVKRGGEIVEKISSGIDNAIGDIRKAAKNVIDEALATVGEKFEEFKSAGKNVIDGFIGGIRDKIAAVGNAASEVGSKALNSIKSFLGIESPAKELITVGKFYDLGLVKGLSKYSSLVRTAAKDVGNTALHSLNGAMSHVSDILNSDMSNRPTIRPILDLSDVRSGAGSIQDILGGSSSIGVMANVGSINSMMNRNRQNGSNDDVVGAINKLGKSLSSGNSGNTYNINGISYDDGAVTNAIETIVRAARMGRRM